MSLFCDRFQLSDVAASIQMQGLDALHKITWLQTIQPQTLDWITLFSELNYYLTTHQNVNDSYAIWVVIERIAFLHREKGIVVFFDDNRWAEELRRNTIEYTLSLQEIVHKHCSKLPNIFVRYRDAIFHKECRIDSLNMLMPERQSQHEITFTRWVCNEITKLRQPGWLSFIVSPFYQPAFVVIPKPLPCPVRLFSQSNSAGISHHQVVQHRRLRPARKVDSDQPLHQTLQQLTLHDSPSQYDKKGN